MRLHHIAAKSETDNIFVYSAILSVLMVSQTERESIVNKKKQKIISEWHSDCIYIIIAQHSNGVTMCVCVCA